MVNFLMMRRSELFSHHDGNYLMQHYTHNLYFHRYLCFGAAFYGQYHSYLPYPLQFLTQMYTATALQRVAILEAERITHTTACTSGASDTCKRYLEETKISRHEPSRPTAADLPCMVLSIFVAPADADDMANKIQQSGLEARETKH